MLAWGKHGLSAAEPIFNPATGFPLNRTVCPVVELVALLVSTVQKRCALTTVVGKPPIVAGIPEITMLPEVLLVPSAGGLLPAMGVPC